MAEGVRVSFVVPAYNEAENLENTIKSIEQAAAGALADYEIVVVDDGSNDDTAEVAFALARENPRIRVFRHEKNRGFGEAFKTGVYYARLPYVMRVCGDDSVPWQSLKAILERIGSADLVIPFTSNPAFRPLHRRALSRAYTALLNWLSGYNLPYYNHCVVFKKSDITSIKIVSKGFAHQAEALVKVLWLGRDYVTVGVEDRARPHGKSKALRLSNFCDALLTLAHLWLKSRRRKVGNECRP